MRSMKINNYVKIRGTYVPTSSLTKEEWLEVSGTILDRFAGKMGYKREEKVGADLVGS